MLNSPLTPGQHEDVSPLIKWGWLRALLFLGGGFVVMAIYRPLRDVLLADHTLGPYEYLLATRSLKLAFFLGLLFFFIRFVDRRDFKSLGFHLNRENKRHLYAGLGLGLAIPLSILGILMLLGNVQIVGVEFQPYTFILFVGLFLTVAFFEELVYRLYFLKSLMASMNRWIALGLVSVFFMAVHADNPGANPLAMVNVFLAGLSLGLYYVYKQNVWFPVAFHFAWNLTITPLIGSAVSGNTLPSVFQLEVSGSTLLTGGDFGFEGSVLATLAFVSIITYCYRRLGRQAA